MNSQPSSRLPSWKTVFVLASVTAVVTYDYHYQVGSLYLEKRIENHTKIAAGVLPGPENCRPLVPFCMEAPIRLLSRTMKYTWAFQISYLGFQFLTILSFLCLLFVFLRDWFTAEQSLIGALFVAVTMAVGLRDHNFHPWSLLEIVLFTGGLILIRRQRYWSFAVVVLMASLNRITGLFFPMVYLFTTLDVSAVRKRQWSTLKLPILWFVAFGCIWLTAQLGVRWSRGSPVERLGEERVAQGSLEPVPSDSIYQRIIKQWYINLAVSPRRWIRTLVNWSVFLGAFWWFVLAGVRTAPSFLRRAALIIPFYFAAMTAVVLYETRPLMTLYPLFVGLGLSYLYSPRRDQADDRPESDRSRASNRQPVESPQPCP